MRRRPIIATALVLAAGLTAGSCSTGGDKQTAASPTTPAATASASGAPSGGAVPPGGTAPAAGVKPVLHGLLDRDGAPPAGFLGQAVAGWVVNAGWADLQPTRDGPIAPDNAIDRAVAAARAYNAAHPQPGRPQLLVGLRLRIRAGIDAPAWAKILGGAPVPVSTAQGGQQSGEQGTVGRFWTPAFGAAYADLQAKLAAAYDRVPEVRETVITRCTTVFAEPFLRNRLAGGDAALRTAGFTTAADARCHREQLEAHRVWRFTNSDLTVNPYQNLDRARGPKNVDDAFTAGMMDTCRQVLGSRCVLANNSLKTPPRYPQLYARMRALGPPLAFQTATARKIGDLPAAIGFAFGLGADSVELPVAYRRSPPSALAGLNAQLRTR